jgi:hypothetical protein
MSTKMIFDFYFRAPVGQAEQADPAVRRLGNSLQSRKPAAAATTAPVITASSMPASYDESAVPI